MIRFVYMLLLFWGNSLSVVGQHHVVINEIMANPNNGRLPLFEYIELYNKGDAALSLAGYTLQVGNTDVVLPSYLLSPKQYVLLCSQQAHTALGSYGNVLALSRWPALNDASATISILQGGIVVESVRYTDQWYGDSAKGGGGWSLERINPYISCHTMRNWSAAVSPQGGTPCQRNSIYDQRHVPRFTIQQAEAEEEKLFLTFDTPLEDFVFLVNHFDVMPAQGQPLKIELSENKLVLHFSQVFQKNVLYTLKTSGGKWCLQDISHEDVLIFEQDAVQRLDVVINEVLFNPKEGGVDFVELYNRSPFPINLQGWRLGARDISRDILLLHAGQHVALTSNESVLYHQYPTHEKQFVVEMASLPSYANQQGVVTLFSPHILVDSLSYHASMHQPFLKNLKGVSLERQSADLPTNGAGNFRSASTLSGGATPGYKNSNHSDDPTEGNNLFLKAKTVSPNGDFYQDFLEIVYAFEKPNKQVTIEIYAENGRLVKRLVQQKSAGSSGEIHWNCLADNGQLISPGLYILLAEIYDESGYREVKKEAFVVTYQAPKT